MLHQQERRHRGEECERYLSTENELHQLAAVHQDLLAAVFPIKGDFALAHDLLNRFRGDACRLSKVGL